jgi:hypothetical protein
MRRFQLQVHQSVVNIIGAEKTEAFGNRIVGAFYTGATDPNVLKSNQITEHEVAGNMVVFKVVVARGKDRDGVTLTVPRPLAGSIAECNECTGIGYRNVRDRELCGQCNGLGYLEKLPDL